MSAANLQLAKLALDALSVRDKESLIREWTGTPTPIEPDRLLRPRAAALRLGCTPRTIFSLLASGALTRVRLPGRIRGAGVRESELTALIAGGEALGKGAVTT